jgi:hypothetical protein
MFVDGDGTIYANSYWEEAGRELSIYKNGQNIGVIPNQHQHADGGGITANATYVWATVHEGKISRFNKTGYAENGTEFLVSTATLKGLTASATELFVSDYANNLIKVYSATAQGSLLRSWAVTRPGPLAMDASGNIWVLTYDANAWGPGTGACIKAYSATGSLLKTVTLATGVQAKSIAIDKIKNELLITDISNNMQIQIYNNINGTPAFTQSFGTLGGILSGTKGLVAPLKFNLPNLVGVDANGNIIIWSNGNNTDIDKFPIDSDGMGSCVESYTRSGVRNWQILGLEFVDLGTFDPATDGADIYTKHEHFTMDYSKPDGQQWTWKGWTLDRKKYPNDARLFNDEGSQSTTLMQRVNGKLYMYLTTMNSNGWYIYRFDNTNEGETAVPCGKINQWENLWIDNNGNGQVDAGEDPSAINVPQEELWAKNVDKKGTIWLARITGGIYNYPVQSINSFGVPVYSSTSAQVVATPAPFTDIYRMFYDSDNDIMYLSGYTNSLKNTGADWSLAGRVLARYNSWSTGNRTAAYTINLPYNKTTNESSVSFAVEKDYIFVCGVASRGTVWVYNVSNGALAGTMIPGNNVGGLSKTGWCDLRNSIAAFKKSNGEYLVTVEEDFFGKILVYRWNAGSTTVTGSLTGSVATNTAAVNLSTVGTADWKHYDNVDHKASGTMINSISNVTVIGGTQNWYQRLRNMSWTGGTPTASATNDNWGITNAGIGNGFSFTCVAGNGSNTLYVYCGGNNSGGTLTAHLSNSAAADYVNTKANTTGAWEAVYTLTFNAAQAGQTITVTWKQASGTGNVTLQAAALSGTAKRPAIIQTGIDSPAVTIYPNPSTNYTTVNFGKLLNNEKVHVEVMDLSGKRIYQSGKLSAVSTLQLNTSKYAKGTYVIKITKGLETINKKIVIQ